MCAQNFAAQCVEATKALENSLKKIPQSNTPQFRCIKRFLVLCTGMINGKRLFFSETIVIIVYI